MLGIPPCWLASPPSENDTIYWVDMGLSTISRAKRDQTWREDVVTNGIGRVEGIAVDWIAGEPRRVQAPCEAEDGVVRSRKEGAGRNRWRCGRGTWTGRGPSAYAPTSPSEHLPLPQATSTGQTRASTSSRSPGSMALSATWSSPRAWTSPGPSLSIRRRGEEPGRPASPQPTLTEPFPPCAGD